MFFVGQSGYIITLLLTAFLPVFMLMAKPAPGIQQNIPADSGQAISHLFQHHGFQASDLRVQSPDSELRPGLKYEWMPLFSTKLKKRVFHYLCIFVAPTLFIKTNKAPPAV
jgi:hypothetical protein